MNDRFKFRFYHYETEKMYDVKAICFEGRPTVTVQYNPVLKFSLDSGELIQCTGLRDKNGKLIYEGDIVNQVRYDKGFSDRRKSTTIKCIVKWNDSKLRYYFDNIEKELDFNYFNLGESKEIEVVGNIHENEELLK